MLALPDRPTTDIAKQAVLAAMETVADLGPRLAEVRAKHIAFDALATLYPTFSPARLGLHLSYNKPSAAAACVDSAKRRHWWNDTHVDHVIGALVADQYGERAN